MAIVIIKVGENEPSDYVRFKSMSRHGDIVDVLPEFDGNGNPLSPGKMVEKNFLLLNVDMSGEILLKVRGIISRPWVEGLETDNTKFIRKRLYRFNLRRAEFISSGTVLKVRIKMRQKRNIVMFTKQHKQPEDKARLKKRLSKAFTMADVNRLDKVVPFEVFARAVTNKQTGATLADDLKRSLNIAGTSFQEMEL